MAIPIYLYQDNRKDGTNLWYGQVTHYGTRSLDDLAEEIQENCSLKKSDCLAVNAELVEVIKYELLNSNKVRLDGFGTFSPALRGKGALSEKDYSPTEYVKDVHVNFVASYRMPWHGKAMRKWTSDITYERIGGPLHSKKKNG